MRLNTRQFGLLCRVLGRMKSRFMLQTCRSRLLLTVPVSTLAEDFGSTPRRKYQEQLALMVPSLVDGQLQCGDFGCLHVPASTVLVLPEQLQLTDVASMTIRPAEGRGVRFIAVLMSSAEAGVMTARNITAKVTHLIVISLLRGEPIDAPQDRRFSMLAGATHSGTSPPCVFFPVAASLAHRRVKPCRCAKSRSVAFLERLTAWALVTVRACDPIRLSSGGWISGSVELSSHVGW